MIDAIKNVSSLSLSRGIGSISSDENTTSLLGQTQKPVENAGVSFASVLGSVANNAMETLKTAETKSFEAIQGKANTREVVDAVMEANQSLQTAIALRDKLISAYLDISKMQI
ncbi:flagellar hook-basal body complex protein FliE [Neorhizobium sp. NPDC001467]|uniref:flagellar hook-basal body complex protein FliE n=1 Tax=Neorhizobium sp. NPDC001467 TaxID=3390595 RepID=UPI003D00995E